MSANQKQPPSVVSQSQPRYTQQTQYVSQRPHTPQRNDNYHVATPPTYVQQQPPPNQVNNQVQPLRGMPPTGPPNQASTPPNNDLKVQQMSQPPPMNIAYVPQSQMRPQTQQNYFSRPPAPTNQTRIPNHRQGQQAIYQPQPAQYLQMPLSAHPMTYINASPTVQYYNSNNRPPNYVTSGYQMISPQLPGYSYPQPQAHPPSFYYNPTQLISRTAPQVPTAPQNPTQPSPAPNMVMPQPVPQHPTVTKNKRRSNAIPIIDPSTGRDRLNEMYEQEQDGSHPPSGESSARQTPQPPLPNPNKEVQAAFAKQVAQAIGKDEPPIDELDHQISVHEHMGHHMYPLPTQAVHARIDLVQSSKLQAATKEFIPASLTTAKETTPVVSAITDAVEVTITNKPKDRESPAKSRKQREHIVVTRDNKEKDISKDLPVNDKPLNVVSCNKDDVIQKDVVLSVGTNKDGVSQRDDKKIQKKVDVKPSQSPCVSVSEESLSDSGPVIPSSIPETTTFYSTKSKSNSSQKPKDVPKQSPPTLPPTVVQMQAPQPQKAVQLPPVVVPATQPSKPTNKNNKMRELNLKGASKEGTDMDAYNDNIIDNEPTSATIDTTANVTNVNHTTNDNSETIEYINNSNNLMLNNNVNISNSTVVVPSDTNKTIEISTSDNVTIKPIETKPVLKKIDVTDIVVDIPRPFIAAAASQFNSATTNALSTFKQSTTAPNSLESQDETDRSAILGGDKLVQTKNDTNTKPNPTEANTNEVRSRLCYRDDQWSPANTDGKKVYPRDFLLALSKDPQSLKRPDNLPADILKNDDKARVGDISRFSMGGRGGGPDFSPNFSSTSYPNKSSSQRGAVAKRKSQQGAISTNKGGLNNNNKPQVRYTLSLKDEIIKLHEAENAWRPARLNPGNKVTEYEKQTADLYKKVRGVLNKLTPQKFNTLLDQIRNLNIDNSQRLQGVIDLVFEKAVDEPNFSVAYALLCRELALMQVPLNSEAEIGKEETAAEAVSKKEGSAEYVNFRKLLVTRCQMEFEKNSIDETARNAKVELIDSCADVEKKKEMLAELDEYDRKLRMKSVGNIRFIGELFKQNMLTVNIMQRCLSNLLETKDEESLECLCKLLTTIGQVLDSKKLDLNPIFTVMKDIVDRKYGKVSSRVRFMLQDVIDLRLSNWVPRRQDLNPRTMDQIQKEAENEQMNQQALNSVPITPRRDERGASNTNKSSSTTGKKYGNTNNEDGWSTAASRSSNRSFSIQSEKLKSKPPTGDEPLGSSLMFGSWGRGASIKTQPPMTNTTNMYAALDTLGNECDKRPTLNIRSGSNKGPYNSKGPSLERNYNRQYDGRSSRSGSQHRSRDSSAASQRNAAPVAPAQAVAKPQPTFVEPSAPEPMPLELSLEKMERKFKNIIDEFINNCCNVEECEQDIRNSIPPTVLPQLILAGCVHVLERSKVIRLRTGTLLSHLVKSGVLSAQGYCRGLESVMSEAQELIIDIPTIWESVAELIAPVLWDNATTLRDIYKAFEEPIASNHAHKLLAYIFKLFVFEKGPTFVESLWKDSNFAFTDFMPESQVESFINDNNFGFLVDSSNFAASTEQTLVSYEEIHTKLLAFFTDKSSFDSIINWILANVGGAVKEIQFIRTLATACFQSSIVSEKLKGDILEEKYNFFKRFVDTNPTYELQCLFALQSLINKMEHPQGLLLSICNKLYEDNIFSHESFMAWETNADPAEQEGKGVALMQLTSFFLELKAGEDESSSSASEEN